MRILIDADACPIPAKEILYRVSQRLQIPLVLVANSFQRVPKSPLIVLEVVAQGADEADDQIVEWAEPDDLVISADIPLAARCLAKGARVLDAKGRVFTEESIGDVLANRELMAYLRDMGDMGGGPAPYAPRDRSRFLQYLDDLIQASLKQAR